MIGSKISKRYAKALLSLGQDDGNYDKYGENLQEFVEVCLAHDQFLQVISNQLFSVRERKKILDLVLEKSAFADTVKNFLRLLLDKNRIGAIEEMAVHYSRLTDEISNIIRADVITARPLKKKALDKLIKALKEFTSKDVDVEVKQDESIIGGLVVKIDGLVLDGSIRAQLEGLKESLKRGGYN